MLTRLHIRHFGLIAEAEVTAANGFTVFTGETGAGKSMLIDALSLALGARGGAGFVRQGTDSASIEAEFTLPAKHALWPQLAEMGIENEDDTLTLRRQLLADGKTRCFMNGAKVTQAQLKDIGEQLVDIHGQQDQQILLRPVEHAGLLDRFGGHTTIADEVRTLASQWLNLQSQIEALQNRAAAREREIDLLTAFVAELDKLNPQPDEETALAEERQQLMQNQRLVSLMGDVVGSFGDGEMVLRLNSGHRRLSSAGDALGEEGTKLSERLADVITQLADVEADLQAFQRNTLPDNNRLEEVDGRLHALRAAARKHGVPVIELPAKAEAMRAELAQLQNMEESLAAFERDSKAVQATYVEAASRLSAARTSSATRLAEKIEGMLARLHMPQARFEARLIEGDGTPNLHGAEHVEFYVRTNPGSPYAPLVKAASGGEVSRLMLALEVVFFAMLPPQTLVFDEADTGVGGAVAEAMGQCLAELGKHHQVFAITHLPQVAACARAHLKISKMSDDTQTTTEVVALDGSAREDEIARMLAGAKITDAARAAARSLLEGGA